MAACAGTQVFAQNTKVDTITFALTVQQQSSVSTSATVANAGNWSQSPTHYKTASKKMTQVDLLKAIAIVLHGNASYYTSQAALQLVQGELGGFWNIDDALAQSYEDFNTDGSLSGTFNMDGTDTSTYSVDNVFFPDAYSAYPATIDATLDLNDTTSISAGGDTYARLDTGRHFLPVPPGYATSGEYPVGHMQPWGQIYVKDLGHKDSTGAPLCENVTFFFYLAVQECYDCFYLSSFISDANFSFKAGTQSGPPCCTAPNQLLGKGTDKYYLSLSFDNTVNNSYLNPAIYTNEDSVITYWYEYVGVTGLHPTAGVADGITPDLLPYVDSIRSALGSPSPYEVRFTLNGIMTYNWNLTLINKSDIAADYIGTGSYSANGFGFIGLVCSLLNGSATFAERSVKDVNCCDDLPWYSDWYGPGSDDNSGYFNPVDDQLNFYPYYNIVGGASYDVLYVNDLPDQNESPYNPAAALTFHTIIDPTAYNH